MDKFALPRPRAGGQAFDYLAQFYDGLMDEDYERWATYLQEIWKSFGAQPVDILEVACGTGNITIPLVKKGYKVTAIDRSAAMISQARAKAKTLGLGGEIQYINQDVSSLCLGKEFDLVLCCDSVNYFTTDYSLANFFRQAYLHTKPDGLLLFDLNSEMKMREIYGNQFYAEQHEEFSYFWENSFDDQSEVCTMELTFFISQGDGLFRRQKEIHRQKLWRPSTIFQRLSSHNWQVVGYFGFLTGEEPRSGAARWQFAAKKIAPATTGCLGNKVQESR